MLAITLLKNCNEDKQYGIDETSVIVKKIYYPERKRYLIHAACDISGIDINNVMYSMNRQPKTLITLRLRGGYMLISHGVIANAPI